MMLTLTKITQNQRLMTLTRESLGRNPVPGTLLTGSNGTNTIITFNFNLGRAVMLCVLHEVINHHKHSYLLC